MREPFGVLPSAETGAFVQNGPDLARRSNGFGVGLFYTGRGNFSVGLESTVRRFQRRNDGMKFNAFLATFNLQHFY